MKTHASHQIDFYKIGHADQYPEGTEFVYSNFTARSGKHSNVSNSKGVKFVILQQIIKSYLIDSWNESFFDLPKDVVIEQFRKRASNAMGYDVAVERLSTLHDYGYLPVKIKALPEGAFVPYGVPMFTIVNTDKKFYWLPNSLESVLSAEIWQPISSATTYHRYFEVFKEFAIKTGSDLDFVPFQAHDFSFRGMPGIEAAAKSAFAAIAAGSKGTDTLSGIDVAIDYYNAPEDEFIAGSVSATEHSVMSSSIQVEVNKIMANAPDTTEEIARQDAEYIVFKRLITEIYPTGNISIVSDTFDFWHVVKNVLPKLKDIIMARDGKLIIRPDSGDPADILCGNGDIKDMDCVELVETLIDAQHAMSDIIEEEVRNATPHGEYGNSSPIGYFKFQGKNYKITLGIFWDRHDKQYYYIEDVEVKSCVEYEVSPEASGLIECLWDTFGGYVNEAGYKVLDSHIGAIYGDSITLARQRDILSKLEYKGFASSNVVLGVGSYTYQFVTRDTHGFAMKATSVVVDDKRMDIFKDPKTDDGTKRSAKGLLMVTKVGDDYEVKYPVTVKEEARGCLETVFLDGVLVKDISLKDILEYND